MNAIFKNDIQGVRKLLQDPTVNPAIQNQFALLIAIERKYTSIAQLLLQDPRVDPSVSANLPFREAVRNKNIELIKLLLEDPRVDPSSADQEALITATIHGPLEIVKLLLNDSRVDPSIYNQYPIRVACDMNKIETVKLLLRNKQVDPFVNNQEALQIASFRGNIELVQILLHDPRVVKDRTIFDMADDEMFQPEINELILSEYPKIIQNQAKNLLSLQRTEKHGFGILPNNIRTYMGSMLSGKVGPNVQGQMNKMKVNYNALKRTRRNNR